MPSALVKFKNRKYIVLVLGLILTYFTINAIRIQNYSRLYFETKSDVAIVLGAGTHNGKLSPIYRERINHSVLLYNKGLVEKLLFTGGFGKGEKQSDSEIAMVYALKCGIPENVILIEEKSEYTIENLSESKLIFDSLDLKTVLLVSDPLQMKRAMTLAESFNMICRPSPTKTTMYRSINSKVKSLLYETFYFSVREVISIFN